MADVSWLTIVIPSVITTAGLILNYLSNRRTLAAAEPRVDAETLKLGIENQNAVMESLGRQIEAALKRADQAETKTEELEGRVRHLESELETARDQIEVMVKQLEAARRQNGSG
jgi:predicted  nucleic acid-binding Zn-ribbon protein